MNMSTQEYKDPIVELLNTDSQDELNTNQDLALNDDIQYINRSSSFNQTSSQLTPILNHQSLYSTNGTSNGFDFPHDSHFNFDDEHKIQELEDSTPSPPQKKRKYEIEDSNNKSNQTQQPTGQTPLFIDDVTNDDSKLIPDQQHQELVPQDYQLITHNKNHLYQHDFESLPPIQPLSESIIPNGINITPLILPDLKNESNNHQQQQFIQPKRKKESSGPKSRPAFVMKIWSMVNDPSNKEYIRWNDDGKTFQVFHREDFMKVILPKYFKHNNFASFVRQLNMYGWHKVQDINNGTLNSNCEKSGNNDEIWQFENPNFLRDREDLLDKIVRNKSNSNQDEIALNDNINNHNANINLILQELENIKMNQYTISEELRRVRQDNKTLWQENYLNRERNEIQGRTLDKILKFLSVVYGNNANKVLDLTNIKNNSNNSNETNKYSMTQYSSPIIKRAKTSPPEEFSNNNKSQHQQFYHRPETSYKNKHKDIQVQQQRYRLMLTDQEHKDDKRPSITKTKSTPGSIEEIIRSYDQDKLSENNNANKIYQQLINQDSLPSPKISNIDLPNTTKSYDEIESNIEKSENSLQQVQDWIEKLNNQQQINNTSQIENNDDDFDVNEFLQNTTPVTTNSNVNSPIVITPGSNDGNEINNSKRKRSNQNL